MKLKESHIIKFGGVYYTDKYNITWIDIYKKKKRSKLRFYNNNGIFNVYVVSNEKDSTRKKEHYEIIQLTTIKSYIKFRLLIFIFN